MPSPTQVGMWPVGCAGSRISQLLSLVLMFDQVALAQSQTAAPEPSVKELKLLSVEELMELEVTSVSKRPEKLSETASAVQVITGEDVRRAGASSLPEALRLASNLQVAQIDSRQWAISTRGFNGSSANKLLVLMDGRTLYSPLHAAVFWDVQDTLLEDLDRIEVISGPGATQWGANAVNGVINISTKSAKDTPGLLVSAGGGTELRGFGGVRYGGTAAPGVHYRIYGKYFDRAGTDLLDGSSGLNDWRMTQGGFRVDWDATADDRLTLQGDVYRGRSGQRTSDDVQMSGGNLLGRWSRTLSEESGFTLQWYFDRTHRHIPGTFGEELDTYDLDFQHSFAASERHDLAWGAGYRLIDDRQHNDYPVLAFLPAHVRRELFSIFVQDQITLRPERLHLTLGTKVEHNHYTGFEWQPSVRLAWQPDEQQTVWAAVSRAVRMPSRIDGEFFAPRDPPFTQLQGNPDFLSEELLACELGYRAQPRPQLALALTLFHHDYDRLRSVERVHAASPLPIHLGNNQEGTARGVEVTADYQVTGAWRLRVGGTQLRLRLSNKPGSTAPPPTYTDPEYQFFLRSALDLPGQVEWDATYRVVARITGQRVPAYDELDLRLGWTPSPSWEFSVVGRNLLHRRHGEFNAPSSRQTITRSVYGKVTWRY
ncbi:MAG: TonB-dependent receptor plug domain-containing protein [Verrucomicrobiota bacterium]